MGKNVVKIFSGEFYATDSDEVIMTILGSCISACVRDPVVKVGGMNHFLLPGKTDHPDFASARYGAFAMEELINEILKRGGRRERLEIKVFGGGNIIKSSTKIGSKNVEFIQEYLEQEGMKPISSDLGGDYPRRVNYYPFTGKVMMKSLQSLSAIDEVTKEEVGYKKAIDQKEIKGSCDAELF